MLKKRKIKESYKTEEERQAESKNIKQKANKNKMVAERKQGR